MPVLAVEVAPRDQALDHYLLALDEDHFWCTHRDLLESGGGLEHRRKPTPLGALLQAVRGVNFHRSRNGAYELCLYEAWRSPPFNCVSHSRGTNKQKEIAQDAARNTSRSAAFVTPCSPKTVFLRGREVLYHS